MYSRICMTLFLSIFSYVHGAVGCKDASYHGYRCNESYEICSNKPYDYKMLHDVACPCPCDTFTTIYQRSRCSRCFHYRIPPEFEIQWSTTE